MTVTVAPTCTACGLCLATCPTHALRPAPRRPHVLDARCTDCGECIEICPVDALDFASGRGIGGPARTLKENGPKRATSLQSSQSAPDGALTFAREDR